MPHTTCFLATERVGGSNLRRVVVAARNASVAGSNAAATSSMRLGSMRLAAAPRRTTDMIAETVKARACNLYEARSPRRSHPGHVCVTLSTPTARPRRKGRGGHSILIAVHTHIKPPQTDLQTTHHTESTDSESECLAGRSRARSIHLGRAKCRPLSTLLRTSLYDATRGRMRTRN